MWAYSSLEDDVPEIVSLQCNYNDLQYSSHQKFKQNDCYHLESPFSFKCFFLVGGRGIIAQPKYKKFCTV